MRLSHRTKCVMGRMCVFGMVLRLKMRVFACGECDSGRRMLGLLRVRGRGGMF